MEDLGAQFLNLPFHEKQSTQGHGVFGKIPLNTVNSIIVDYAICSPEDFLELSRYKWHKTDSGYVRTSSLIGEHLMHRYIKRCLMREDVPDGYVVDHDRPGNPLDNRRHMLRIITVAQNAMNKRKREDTTSSFYGVSWMSEYQKWAANVTIHGEQIYIFSSDDEIEVAEEYDVYLLNRSDFSSLCYNLNFPEREAELAARTRKKRKREDKTSAYNGVFFCKANNSFRAAVTHNKKQIQIAQRVDPLQCAIAYDEYVVCHKLDKKLNFPDMHATYEPERPVKTFMQEIDDVTVKLLMTQYPDVVFLLDKADYDLVKYHKCHSAKTGYVMIRVDKKKMRLNRFLMQVIDPKIFVDHKNRNRGDNRRNNLRLSNAKRNPENQTKRKNASSDYFGVQKDGKKYRAVVYHENKQVLKKKHNTEEQAARHRDIFIMSNLPLSHYETNFTWTPDDIQLWKTKLKF